MSNTASGSWKLVISIGCLLFILSLGLRLYNLEGINNYIDDLSARQAILALDISHGIQHFPYSPYFFEFDESGMAYLTYPFVMLLGFKWKVFQLLSALSGAFATLVLFFIVYRLTDFGTGLVAALIYASLPCMLIWNRFYFMSCGDLLTTTTLAAIYLAMNQKNPVVGAGLAGFIIGSAFYITSLSVVSVPALIVTIYLKCKKLKIYSKMFLNSIYSYLTGLCLTLSVIIIKIIHEPFYLLWRKRHFVSAEHLLELIKLWFVHLYQLSFELIRTSHNFLHQPSGKSLLTAPLIAGIVWCFIVLRKNKHKNVILICSAYSITWFILIAALKSEPWRGTYFIFLMPFLFILSGIGLFDIYSKLANIGLTAKSIKTVGIVSIFAFIAINTNLFFNRIPKVYIRDDIITRLQSDLQNQPDIPYFFSNRITDVGYYHFPFWFVTRLELSRVSVFDWDNNMMWLPPDDVPLNFEPDTQMKVAFVEKKENMHELLKLISQYRCSKPKELEHSGLFQTECYVMPEEIAKRTWTDTVIPPLIAARRNR